MTYSGTETTTKQYFTPREVCTIIRASAAHGVKEITISDLHVKFHEASPAKEIVTGQMEFPDLTSPAQTQAEQQEITTESKRASREELLATLALESPVEYEQMMLRGEIEVDEEA